MTHEDDASVFCLCGKCASSSNCASIWKTKNKDFSHPPVRIRKSFHTFLLIKEFMSFFPFLRAEDIFRISYINSENFTFILLSLLMFVYFVSQGPLANETYKGFTKTTFKKDIFACVHISFYNNPFYITKLLPLKWRYGHS